MALKLCDMVPGWYRDNYPAELAELKRLLYEHTYDTIEYCSDDDEAEMLRETGEEQWTSAYCYPRAQILESLIDSLQCTPWIFDLGASHGNAPVGLIKSGKKFTYKGVGMNWRIIQKVKGWVGDHWKERPEPGQKTILFCTEVLEHCPHPEDLVHSAYKVGVNWDHIIFSTPKYTLGNGLPEIKRRLGHVRTWTPNELGEFCAKNWPGYSWRLYPDFSMVIHGSR